MKARKALVGSSAAPGGYELAHDVNIPSPNPGMMLCKVAAVAVTPVDAKMADYSPSQGSIGGCDFAGEIVEVGRDVTRFKPGDRVFGLAFGLNPDDKTAGAFSEYSLATEDLTYHMPPWMTFQEASTFPIGIGTALCSLYGTLGLPTPDSPAETPLYVLVSGGATASGLMAIQFLKISGLWPIATCSPKNFARVKSLGAVQAFDYNGSACGMEIRNYTENTLSYALDCVASSETMYMCFEAIGTSGGRYVALEPPSRMVKYTRRDVYADWVMAFTLFGNPVRLSGAYGRPAMPSDRQLAARCSPMVERLISERMLTAPRIQERSGGLEALQQGIDDVRKGKIKGYKLVYRLD
ncbi:alcohol dehydrogenase GroES-like domain-containing protein [Xylariaceae sp. FL1651]|nr:alcohol dehydrogenase GroES-like domain-containing protein [Xylariaceae sp. FL1651]